MGVQRLAQTMCLSAIDATRLLLRILEPAHCNLLSHAGPVFFGAHRL